VTFTNYLLISTEVKDDSTELLWQNRNSRSDNQVCHVQESQPSSSSAPMLNSHLPYNMQTTAFLSSCGDRTALFSRKPSNQKSKFSEPWHLAACGYHVGQCVSVSILWQSQILALTWILISSPLAWSDSA